MSSRQTNADSIKAVPSSVTAKKRTVKKASTTAATGEKKPIKKLKTKKSDKSTKAGTASKTITKGKKSTKTGKSKVGLSKITSAQDKIKVLYKAAASGATKKKTGGKKKSIKLGSAAKVTASGRIEPSPLLLSAMKSKTTPTKPAKVSEKPFSASAVRATAKFA